jgi:REP element-mobilizing transposase RayT
MASQYRTSDYLPYGLLHVTCRGFERKQIFFDDRDHAEFSAIFRRLVYDRPFESRPKLISYGQMPNHQHLFLQHGTSGEVVPGVMHLLKIKYAQYFNDRYGRSGPVFESPYRGRVVRAGDDVANVLTYIHLNPDLSLRETNSSHPVYTGETHDPFIDQSIPLRVLGGKKGYNEFFSDTARIRQARQTARRRF